MQIKATWKNKNPFEPDVDKLGYTKTVEVPDDTDMEVIRKYAIEDTKPGYVFEKIEVIEERAHIIKAAVTQKTTLRAQWNSRQGCWRIVKKTDNGCGGWKMFGGAEGYPTRLECEIKIEDIVSKFPDQYQEEEEAKW